MAVPGERPTSPVIVLDPVLVTVDPASTANGLAASRFTVAVAPNAGLIPKDTVRMPAEIAEIPNREKNLFEFHVLKDKKDFSEFLEEKIL